MANIILKICGIALILNAGALVSLIIELAEVAPKLKLERVAAMVVAILAVGAGVFFMSV